MIKIQKLRAIQLSSVLVLSITILTLFSTPMGTLPRLGELLLPGSDIWEFPGDLKSNITLTSSELSSPVEIFIDEWGVPHIYSQSETDAMYTMGYLHAKDRLFFMDMARRSCRGRMSEILGPDSVSSDMYNLNIMMEYWVQKTVEKIREDALTDPESQNILYDIENYTAGINYYINTAKAFPLEYALLDFDPAPWTLEDSFAMQKYMAQAMSFWPTELLSYSFVDAMGLDEFSYLFGDPWPFQIPIVPEHGDFPDTPNPASQEDPLVELSGDLLTAIMDLPQTKLFQPLSGTVGSNNWVVDGSKSYSGKPILANDMHVSMPLPCLWYQGHIVIDDPADDLNLWGFFLPGVPYPLVGHNDYVGWGFSNTQYDVLDWYFYEGVNDTHYMYKGAPTAYETETYAIDVKNGESVPFTVKRTVHGPIFTEFMGEAYPNNNYDNYQIGCRWIGHETSEELKAFYGFAHATNRAEFDEASEFFWAPAQNIIYADIDNNIGIRPTGKVPIRDDSNIPENHPGNGSLPYNGSAGHGEWIDWLDFSELPHSENPSQGYLASSNQIIAGPDYLAEHDIQDFYDSGLRSRRIDDLLANHNNITVGEMEEFQLDVFYPLAESLMPYLLDTLNTLPVKTPLQQTAIDYLTEWDFEMTVDSAAASIFRSWFEQYEFQVFYDEFNEYDIAHIYKRVPDTILENITINDPTSHWFDDIETVAVEGRDAMILRAFENGTQGLVDYFGSDDLAQWEWGKLHFVKFPHLSGLEALGAGPYPHEGGSDTLNHFPGEIWNGDSVRAIECSVGPVQRMVIDFNDFSKSSSVIAGGQSGVSSSRHYTDQLELYLAGEFHPNYFEADLSSKFKTEWTEATISFIPGGI